MTEKLFMGSALCAVDAQRAMTLPAFVRVPLGLRSDGAALYLGSHEVDPCLVAYDPAEALALQLECRRLRFAEEETRPGACDARARRIFGLLQAVPIDAGGRCVLPDLLCRRARIRDTVLVVGTGGSFEIWSVQAALYGHDNGMRALAALSLELPQAA